MAPMQNAQDHDSLGPFITCQRVNDKIGQAGNGLLAGIRHAPGTAEMRVNAEAFDESEQSAADAPGGRRVLAGDPFDDAKKIRACRFGPAKGDHRVGATIRSKAATTVA